MYLRFLLGITSLTFVIFGQVFAEDNLLYVFHFPQMHRVDGIEGDLRFNNAVAESQFNIAQAILKRPQAEVFAEGLYEDYTPEHYEHLSRSSLSMVHAAKLIFSDGLPENFGDLNKTQIEFLSKISAPVTLFYLGLLKQVRASLSHADNIELEEKLAPFRKKYGKAFALAVQMDKDLKKIIYDLREQKTVEMVLAAGKKYPEIIIVYGSGHNFEPYFEGNESVKFFRESHLVSEYAAQLLDELSGFGNEFRFAKESKDLVIQPLVSDLDISNAMVYYGNMDFAHRSERDQKRIIKEQEKIIQLVEESGKKFAAWEWQHFVTSQLKKSALQFLDFQSLNDLTFSIESFKQILAKDADLNVAGEEWLFKNGLNPAAPKASDPKEFIESLDKSFLPHRTCD